MTGAEIAPQAGLEGGGGGGGWVSEEREEEREGATEKPVVLESRSR